MKSIGLGRLVRTGKNEYLLQNRPCGWTDDSYFEHIIGCNNCTNVTLSEPGKEPFYSSLMLVFDDAKILKKKSLFTEADMLSAELADAVKLAKFLHRRMKIDDEHLKERPIIIIPHYYDKERDFSRNEFMANGYFAGTTDTSYSVLAVNITPCTDQYLKPYLDNYDEGNEILMEAHKDSAQEGFTEIDGDPTMYMTSRYVAKWG